jgi:hypothetical protein
MCNFLSFTILQDKDGLQILAADLKQHDAIEQKFNLEPQKDVWFEAEWTGNGQETLEIRFPENWNKGKQNSVYRWVFNQFSDRDELIDFLLKNTIFSDCDLDLSGTGVTELPEGLSVGGYLDLRGTGVTELPEGLSVGGSLYLSGTGVTKIPNSCKNCEIWW